MFTVDDERGIALRAGRESRRRLLGRQQSRQHPLRRFARRARRDDRQDEVVPAARASRHLGLRRRRGAGAHRRAAQRTGDSRRRAADEDGAAVHLQSRDRRADLRHGRAEGAADDGARRVDVADAAVPGQAPAARAQFAEARGARQGDAGARGVLRRPLGQVQAARRRAVRPVAGRTGHRRVPGRAGRRQLARRDVQQDARPHHHERHGRGTVGSSRRRRPRRRRRGRRPDAPPAAPTPAPAPAGELAAGVFPPALSKQTPEGGRFWDAPHRYSCSPPPWGELVAVNANTGDIAWHVPLGEFEELDREGHPADRHAELRRRDHDRRQSRVHRRDDRRLLPRVRRAQRQGAVARQAAQPVAVARRPPTRAATASSTSSSARTAAASSARRPAMR